MRAESFKLKFSRKVENKWSFFVAAKPHFDQESKELADRRRVFKMSGRSVNFSSLSGPSAVDLAPQIVGDTSCHELFGWHILWDRHLVFFQQHPSNDFRQFLLSQHSQIVILKILSRWLCRPMPCTSAGLVLVRSSICQ